MICSHLHTEVAEEEVRRVRVDHGVFRAADDLILRGHRVREQLDEGAEALGYHGWHIPVPEKKENIFIKT